MKSKRRPERNILNDSWRSLFSKNACSFVLCSNKLRTRVLSLLITALHNEGLEYKVLTVKDFLLVVNYSESKVSPKCAVLRYEFTLLGQSISGIGIKGQKLLKEIFKHHNIKLKKT